MKRSRQVVLVLSGMVAGCAAGCSPSDERVVLNPENTYTNNHYVTGAGYYHAPYHGWFPLPYNSYSPGRGYYHGGTWTADPDPSPVTTSRPSAPAVHQAQSSHNTTVRRGGFGRSTHWAAG